MRIQIELDGVALRVLLAFGLAIWGVSGVDGGEIAGVVAALLDK